jgi:two-component system, LuxR family, response regulator FixJ
MNTRSQILVVDDDAAVRDSIRVLLESAGFGVRTYVSAMHILADCLPQDACIITDIRMPNMDGFDLQKELTRRGVDLPVIIITGHGEVPLAVRAMKAGAVDFIEKPFDDAGMVRSIQRALEIGRRGRDRKAEGRSAQGMLARLTPRERHVLDRIVNGRSNKIAAYELGLSPRTIEIHRAHIMNKMSARSVSDLVRIAIAAQPLQNCA